MKFSKLVNQFEEGIFTSLTNKKIELEESGRKIYNLFVGTPDFKPRNEILDVISKEVLNPENMKYSLRELPELKNEFIKHYKSRFNVDLKFDEIALCNGTQEGMCHIGMVLADEDDICLLPDPGYPAFLSSGLFARCKPVFYPLLEENDFMPRLDLLDEEILKKTKYVIISYPSNPTGGMITKERYNEIIELALKYDFIIINDNAYSDIVFDSNQSFSFLSLPHAFEVGVEFYSLSKSYNTTGARISFLLGNKEIVKMFKQLRSQYDFGMYLPIQYGAIEALRTPKSVILEQRLEYEKRRNTLCDGLSSIGWDVKRSKGTMFVFAKIPQKYKNSLEFSMELLNKANVLSTPGSAFGLLGDRYVRFALVLDCDTLKEVIESIKNANIL